MILEFIKRFFCFVSFLLIALLAVSCFHLYFLKTILQSKNIGIGENIDVIIIGDSHTQTGINESMLLRSVNISANSMHYVYSYVILKTLLNANPQVKAVVLGYSYHNLNAYYDDLLRDGRKARFKMGDYYLIFGSEEEMIVRANTVAFYEVYAKYHFGLPIQLNPHLYIKAILGRLTARDFPFWGKSYMSKHSNISPASILKTIQRHFYLTDLSSLQRHSLLQQRYLVKIAQLCQSKGVAFYLLMTPLHPNYRSKIPIHFINEFQQSTQELKDKFPSIELWDYSKGQYADFMYGDADHLNVYGAQIFSRIINRRLDEIRTQGFRK